MVRVETQRHKGGGGIQAGLSLKFLLSFSKHTANGTFPKSDEPIQYLMSYFFKILVYIKHLYFRFKIQENIVELSSR